MRREGRGRGGGEGLAGIADKVTYGSTIIRLIIDCRERCLMPVTRASVRGRKRSESGGEAGERAFISRFGETMARLVFYNRKGSCLPPFSRASNDKEEGEPHYLFPFLSQLSENDNTPRRRAIDDQIPRISIAETLLKGSNAIAAIFHHRIQSPFRRIPQ